MKKFATLGLVGLMFLFGAVAVSTPAAAADALVAAAGDVQLCPLCGKPLVPGHVHEEKEEGLPFSIGTDHAFLNKYVWRGLNVTDDPVWQPDVWISYKGFTANVWANMDLTDVNGNEGEFNEFDYTLNYAGDYDKLSYTVGLIHYQFPNTAFIPTTEAYGVVGYDTLLQPSLTVYYDFDEADGVYGMLGLAHSFELPQFTDMVSMSLDLSTHIGFASKNWNNYYYGADHTAFVDFVAGATLPIAVGDHLTVSPAISYSTVVDKALSSKAANEHAIIWGVVVSAEL